MDLDNPKSQKPQLNPLTLTDTNSGEQYDIAHETLIGREVECSIALDSPHVSRYHAKIIVAADATTIEDLNSSNGTFVNGKRIDARSKIGLGDEIGIDNYHFRLTTKGSGKSDATVVLSKDKFKSSALETYQRNTPESVAAQSVSEEIEAEIDEADDDSTRMLSNDQINNIAEINKKLQKLSDTGSGPRFVATTAPIRGKVFALDTTVSKDEWRFGRSRECEICVSAPSISRHHGTIRKDGGRFYFFSEPGKTLRINDVEKPKSLLKHNDQILIGPVEFIFRLDEQQTPPNKNSPEVADPQSWKRIAIISTLIAGTVAAIVSIFLFQNG